MNIPHYYRKLVEKSRTFLTEHITGRLINIFLFAAAIVVLALVAVNQTCKLIDKPKRVDITISWHGMKLFGDTMGTLIWEFEEQNPGLRIRILSPEASADASGTGADIVFFDDGEYSSLKNGSYARTETLISFMDVFIYNVDILKEAGLDRPPKSRAEFLDTAKAVAQSGTALPFALGLSPADPVALRRDFYPWVWMNGGDIYAIDIAALLTDEKRTTGSPLPRTVTDIVAFFGQLNREGLLAPGTFEKTGTQRLEEFAAGKVAMTTASVRDIAFLRSKSKGINFDVTAVPANNMHGKNRLGLSSIYAGINSNSVLPDEAAKFLAFLVEKRHILAETLGAVPGSFPGVFSGEYIVQDPVYSKAWDIFQMAEIVEYAPDRSFEEAIDQILREKLVEAFSN